MGWASQEALLLSGTVKDMSRIVKWLGIGVVGVVGLALVLAIVIVGLASRTVQPLSGEAQIAGLSAAVEVVRDKHGVPHILAETRADAMRALGFAHAQDRLWQMEMLRMTGQGRLSEILGQNSAVQNIDVFLRTLGFLDQARSSLSIISAENRELLEAYAEGVNHFINRETRAFEASVPPEFLILGHAPELWEPAHSLVVLKLMSLQLSMNMGRELGRLKLAARGLNSAEISDIMPHHRDETPPIMPDPGTLYPLLTPDESKAAAVAAPPELAGILDMNFGRFASNNWVLAGQKTATGKPLLANDPHLAFNAPSLWYLAHLRWKDGGGAVHNAVGATIPSVPAIVLGRNDHLAWGFTNAGADVQDLYVERVKDGDENSYFGQHGWEPFRTSEEVIKVKDGQPVTFTRRVGRHGPVLPRTFSNYGDFLGNDMVLSLSWTGLSSRDDSFGVVSDLAMTKTVEEFGEVTRRTVSPMQAIVVADRQGSIGLFAQAAVPKRKPENRLAGRVPAPGWQVAYDWEGLVPASEMTAIINPPNGALGTANSRFIRPDLKAFMTHDWDEPYRQDRVLQTMVNANGKLGMDDMVRGQLDDFSPAMVDLRDLFLNRMEPRPRFAAVLDRLKAWNGRMAADKPEPLLMAAWFRNTLEGLLKDDLGPVLSVAHTAPAVTVYRIITQGGARDWCDTIGTGAKETCADVISTALDKTMMELSEEHGSNFSAWKWGDAHVVSNQHQPFTRVGPLARLFDIERPVSGGAYTLLRAKPDLGSKTPFKAVHGAGYRAVYDLSDLDKSRFIQTTGQSGNVMSDLYSDQADLWAKGDYITIPTEERQIRSRAVGTWSLAPLVKAAD